MLPVLCAVGVGLVVCCGSGAVSGLLPLSGVVSGRCRCPRRVVFGRAGVLAG